jgi:hypothetical protein
VASAIFEEEESEIETTAAKDLQVPDSLSCYMTIYMTINGGEIINLETLCRQLIRIE